MTVSNLLCAVDILVKHFSMLKFQSWLQPRNYFNSEFFWSMVSIWSTLYDIYPHTPPCNGRRTTSTQRYPRHILQNKPSTRIPNYAVDQTKNILCCNTTTFKIWKMYINFLKFVLETKSFLGKLASPVTSCPGPSTAFCRLQYHGKVG